MAHDEVLDARRRKRQPLPVSPHEKGAALAAYMERVGAKKQGGKRKTDATCPTLGQVAEKLGIPKQTASDQLKAAADYKAAAPNLKAKVDAGEITPKQARAVDWSRRNFLR